MHLPTVAEERDLVRHTRSQGCNSLLGQQRTIGDDDRRDPLILKEREDLGEILSQQRLTPRQRDGLDRRLATQLRNCVYHLSGAHLAASVPLAVLGRRPFWQIAIQTTIVTAPG